MLGLYDAGSLHTSNQRTVLRAFTCTYNRETVQPPPWTSCDDFPRDAEWNEEHYASGKSHSRIRLRPICIELRVRQSRTRRLRPLSEFFKVQNLYGAEKREDGKFLDG